MSGPPLKVLVTGARGQLAGAIIDAYKDTAEVLAYSRRDLDVADYDAVMALADGCPTSGLAVLEVPGTWAGLDGADARLVDFTVPRPSAGDR